MIPMLISGNTDPGKRRKENQDAFIIRPLWSPDKALMAVVDGVGGYAGGEKAATIARDSIGQYMQLPKGDTLTMLREAVLFANNQVVEERKKDQQFSEMACVLTAAVVDETTRCMYFAHVGDTRLYRYRSGSLQKLTKDHSIVGIREDAGEITELEAMNHPHRHQILREVGAALHRLDDEDFMDYGKEELLPGDLLLLCSDGLTDMLTVQQMQVILSTATSLNNKVNNLIALANEMGGHDNITVVLFQYQAIEDPQPASVETPELTTAPATTSPTPSATHPEKSKLLWAALIVLLIAGAGWYFSPPKKPIDRAPASVRDNTAPTSATIKTDSLRLLPLPVRTKDPAVKGPPANAKADTLRITSTQDYSTIQHYLDSTGRELVLLPAKRQHPPFAAVRINSHSVKPGDTLVIHDLHLKNFETGILVQVAASLKTENLSFEKVRYPFSYRYKPDSLRSAVLFMNTPKQ